MTEGAVEKPTRVKRPVKESVSTDTNVVVSETQLAAKNGEIHEVSSPPNIKVVKLGDIIEVRTNDDGIALETVWEERELPNSSRKTAVLVAGLGTYVPVPLRAK